MPPRLTGGFLSVFDTRNEKYAAVLSGLTFFAIAFFAPPPRRRIVNGEEIADLVAYGWAVPKWALFLIAGIVLVLLFQIYKKLLSWIWPEERVTYERVTVEKVFPREGGGFIAWKPEIPGTPSPMEYSPPTFTMDTTAAEFLAARPPNPMRVLLGGDFDAEALEYDELRDRWLHIAPESTLQELLHVGEQILLKDSNDDDVIHALIDASNMRGVPTTAELIALADKIGNDEFRSWLGD